MNAPEPVGPATTFANPLTWPVTKTFTPTDVLANTGGAGIYGMLGFQALAG